MNAAAKNSLLALLVLLLLFPSPSIATPKRGEGGGSAPLVEVKIPTGKRFVLDNGIVVHFLQNDELPLLHLAAIVRGGAADDPDGLEGCAGLMFAAMRLGTKTHPVQEIDDELDRLAIDITTDTGEEYSSISLSTLRENVDTAVDIFTGMITAPSFVDSGWSITNKVKTFLGLGTLRKIAKDELMRLADNQQALVFKHFNRLLHKGSRRQRLPSQESLDAIGGGDLVFMYRTLVTPERVYLAASGAISEAELKEKLNRTLGKWQALSSQRAPLAIPQRPAGGVYFLVKDSPQSIIIKGWLAPRRASAEAYPLEIAHTILGGEGHISRLFREIRTKRGYAYATGSFYRQGYDFGIVGAYAFVKAEETIPAVLAMNEVIATARKEGFSAAEIAKTKESLRNRFVFLFTSPFDVAKRLAEKEYAKLPPDLYERHLEKLSAVTVAEMSAVINDYMKDEESLTIITGKKEQLEKLRVIYPHVGIIENRD